MQTPAVTHHDCIRLLAGTGINMPGGMVLEHSNAAPHCVQQTQAVVAVMLLGNATYSADLAYWTLIVLGQ
jgi:hypothetical protein